jgi:hypothetical protein
MNEDLKTPFQRRRFLRLALSLPVCLAAGMSSGCALPMLMKAKTKKTISQDHFSCGENCPHAVKESGRHQ